MPTGYTHQIAGGITFKEFALSCAKAFGACITMRDQPSDAPIPDEFKPATYNSKAAAEAREKLAKVKAMTSLECEGAAKADFQKSLDHHTRSIEEDRKLEAKYRAMLAEVEAFNPPSDEHQNLKKFMREQILESIKFDCSTDYHEKEIAKLKPAQGEEWRQAEIKVCLHVIAYHDEEQRKENERTASRNLWVSQLRSSLK